MLIRIKFHKTGFLRFVGHLDLMRTLQKNFRRAGINIAYSEGYNPHQIFSIAAPLSIGVTSEGEYLDMKLKEESDLDVLLQNLNDTAPEGLNFVEAKELVGKTKSAMAAVSKAKYEIAGAFEKLDINGFLEQDSIIITKKTKKGKLKELDLRPGIYKAQLDGERLVLIIATGSAFNIKPEQFLEALCNYSKQAYNRYAYQIHRKELYQEGASFVTLLGQVENE